MKMVLKEIRLERVDWVCQARDKDQCQSSVEHWNTCSGSAKDEKFLV